MKKIKNSNTRILCKGNNIAGLINKCVAQNILLQNAIRLDAKSIEFDLNDLNLKKFKTLDLKNYTIAIQKSGGIESFKRILKFRCGLFVGIIVSILSLFFIDNRLLNINISGLNNYSESAVIDKINEFGLNYFSKMNVNTEELEVYLTNSFNFSLVSIVTKGNTLIVNVKEEITDITDKYLPITADYNMVITSINIYAGTGEKGVGDVVYKGDIIVYAYEIVNDEKIEVMPMAEICGDVFFSSRYNFLNEEKINKRSGNKQLISCNYSLGKYQLFEDMDPCNFSQYEIEESNEIISYYILPIKVKKLVAYEIIEETITRNFEEEKENIISNLKDEVYSKVPENIDVESEEIQISSTNYGNIVTIYLKSSVYLNYK